MLDKKAWYEQLDSQVKLNVLTVFDEKLSNGCPRFPGTHQSEI